MTDQSGAGHLDRQEIIIVRRRGGHGEEAHHGGVWKIAFADFMTAMMAFFLVMWLTQASDMATRKQVAQYFNPIRLNDASPATRGVEQSDDGASREENENGISKADTNGDPHGKPLAGDQEGGEEEALFRDPYAVLAEIAAEGASETTGELQGKPDGTGLPGLNGGDAYRDPFDPSSWQLAPNATESEIELDQAPPSEFKTAVLPSNAMSDEPVPVDAETQAEAIAAAGAETDAAADEADESDTETAGEAEQDPATAEASAEADKAAVLKAELAAEFEKEGTALPANFEVVPGKGGITISIADDMTSGMFQVGSARPTAQVVAMMERIAAVLARQPGDVSIRGHTDSRPFRSGQYDNWRLSTARAQMAYYMLTRGGLEENRVKAIEGVADRAPKIAEDPEAAANRRIEILLTTPAT
ncbi:MotB family protein [Aurantimonas sp. A2-1-M11]|uniref:MotB family protein n=1 Tax=Aurantimonas sp. A2-1-M11 TaxID=3113712 RepID=UPI002F95D231